MTKQYFLQKTKRNLKKNIFLIIIIMVLMLLLFGESVINTSMNKGVKNLERRLGADLMIVPKGSKENAENLLIEGQRSNFYFGREVYEKLKELEGISEITAQCYLKSLSADCCSSEVEIVFFDPKTDFLVQPWIMKEYGKSLNENSVVVGYNVAVLEDKTIELFGEKFSVVAQMTKTGSSLDNSVYFYFDAEEKIVKKAEEKGVIFTQTQKDNDIISTVYINLKPGSSLSDVLKQSHLLIGDEFEVVYPKELTASMENHLKDIKNIVNILVKATALILFILLFLIINISMNQRKREIALYRITGSSKRGAVKMLLIEFIEDSICGVIIGGIIGIIVIIPFGSYIGRLLEMPYLGPDCMETISLFALYLIIVILIVSIAALYPIIRICSMQPYLALRREAE
jgi:putative ABC transport system permease protein